MTIKIAISNGVWNTSYAPLAVLCEQYLQKGVLEPLRQVEIGLKTHDFTPHDKLIQVYLSILAGCETLVEVNTKLRPEQELAAMWSWPRFADQSSLSRALDALTLTNLEQLRYATTQIWRQHSQVRRHDWRKFLWLDFDLSGLPCSVNAEESKKGYFAGKKTSQVAN